MAKPIIPLETRRGAVELVSGGMRRKQAARQLGVGIGAVHNRARACRRGGMAALQLRNRNAAQGGKPAASRRRPSAVDDDDDDAGALRRRVGEPEPEGALMREVVEVAEKDPGADLRRLSDREKTLLIDRLGPAYPPGSMTCLLAIAPGNPADRDFTAERPNGKRLADITGIKAGDGKGVPLADDRLPRWQDRRAYHWVRSQRGAGQPDAGGSGCHAARGRASPGAFRPRPPLPVARMAGPHGTVRPGAVDGREGLFAGQRRRGGVLRAYEDGVRLSRALGGAYP